MMWISLFGAIGLLASVRFANTVTAGTLIVGVLIVIGFGWASRKDRRSERWEKLYNLADAERKEVQEKLDQAMERLDEAILQLASQKEVISKLEALQMPTRVMEVMRESVKVLNAEAAHRQDEIRRAMIDHIDGHEVRDQERTQLIITTQEKLLTAIAKLTDKIPPHFGATL